MSELITVNPGTPSTGPVLGLNIINEQPVTLFRESTDSPTFAVGSGGNDSIEVASPNDSTTFFITGGPGNDTITGGSSGDNLSGNGGNDNISGGRSGDAIFGGLGNDQLAGDDGIDIIDAGRGDDTVNGGQGNDTLLGGPGNDELFGEAGEDLIRGGDGEDTLFGGDGSDVLKGGAGDDILVPGAGRDVMKGGFGQDTFRFTPGSTGVGQLDRIIDFKASDDTIEISRSLLPGSGLQTGELTSDDFEVVEDLSQAIVTTGVLIYEQKSGIVYYNPTDGKDVPLFQLQANLSDINASNFTIF